MSSESTQSDPNAGFEPTATGRLSTWSREGFKSFLRVLPAIAAGALFAHLCWFGLRPTLEERGRLDAAEAEVLARFRGELEVGRGLGDLDQALDDDLYRERVRRQFARERAEEAEAAAASGPLERDPSWFGAEVGAGGGSPTTTESAPRPSEGQRSARSLVR